MFSLKSSFANCASCSLLDAPSCILETNCKDDLTKVDVVFVSENPGKNEVKREIPLIGEQVKPSVVSLISISKRIVIGY